MSVINELCLGNDVSTSLLTASFLSLAFLRLIDLPHKCQTSTAATARTTPARTPPTIAPTGIESVWAEGATALPDGLAKSVVVDTACGTLFSTTEGNW